MTVQGLTLRMTKVYHRFLVQILSNSQLKMLIRETPFQDIRVRIWKKLGNQIVEGSQINNTIILLDSPELFPNITLGDRVAMGTNVTFITASSPNNSVLGQAEYAQRFIRTAPISIGDDTWIGANCVIQPGIRIGKRCIIGSCSNVTRDIPDDCLAYGNPAKIIRRLTE